MQLLEFQGKQLLAESGIAVPTGHVVHSPEEAARAAADLGGPVVLKSQVPSGKRGKAGAVQFATDAEQARSRAEELLGMTVAGHPVTALLVEARANIASELYAAILNDPASKGPLVLFSTEGGMDIEEVSARSPEKVLRQPVDIRVGLTEADAAALVAASDLPAQHQPPVATALLTLYATYREIDAELVEVNPLVLTADGAVLALDAKVALDPAGLARHPDYVDRFEPDLPVTRTDLEEEGRRQGFLFMELDGDVALLANGAGLTMSTLDAVHHHGGQPANFLEIGGDAYTKALPALRLVLSNPRVRSLLVNFCGAFARTDVMTEGVVAALEELQPQLPISFSIHGTGEEDAIRLVRERLGVAPHERMDDAVREAVANAAASGRAR